MQFEDLNLIHHLLRAVRTEGYAEPTPIQEQAIPHVLAGRDVLGCAQTGTGKTAAFALPILQRLSATPASGNGQRAIRALVLAPTRELATQIGESFQAYGRHTGLKSTIIYGGVGQNPQVQALKRGIDILVATPGRLLDLMGQGFVHLERIEMLVLDEADRMLDMGFIHDVRRVVDVLPRKRQTLLFSATMPRDIQELADAILVDPVRVSVSPSTMTVEATEQAVYFVEKSNKPALLEHLLDDPSVTRALVFTRTKHGANRVVKQLARSRVQAEPIHGNKSQTARERALANFKSGKTRVLVATDIAARGIDVDSISHVINYDLPNEPETYVHRIGRTGRAGAAGIALSFCSADERAYLRDIERLIRQHVEVIQDHPYISGQAAPSPASPRPEKRQAAPSAAPARPEKRRPASAAAPIDKKEGSDRKRRRHRRNNQARQPQEASPNRERAPQPATRPAHRAPAPEPAPSSGQPRRAPRLIR
jgi:ATP-dependent RNA helicase RhlE